MPLVNDKRSYPLLIYLNENDPDIKAGNRFNSLHQMYFRLNDQHRDLISVMTYAKCSYRDVFNKFDNHPETKIIAKLINDDLNSILNLDPRDNGYIFYEIATKCSSNEIIYYLRDNIILRNWLELQVLNLIAPNTDIPKNLHLYIRKLNNEIK
jgi:hypothetical protein